MLKKLEMDKKIDVVNLFVLAVNNQQPDYVLGFRGLVDIVYGMLDVYHSMKGKNKDKKIKKVCSKFGIKVVKVLGEWKVIC